MLMSSKPDFSHHNPLYEIKQDDKFFTKLVTKETSIANPSFRSGLSVAVPFVWESQPGTPRHKLFPDPDSIPPTLTPPPSYYSSTPTPNHEKYYASKKKSKSKLLNFWLLRIIHFKKGAQVTMSPTSPFSFSTSHSSSSSLSSYSSSSRSGNSSVPTKIGRGRRRLLSMGSLLDDDDFQVSAPRSISKSVLCFRS